MQAPEELRTRAVMLEAGVEAGRRERASEDWYYLFSFPSIVFCNILRYLSSGRNDQLSAEIDTFGETRVAR